MIEKFIFAEFVFCLNIILLSQLSDYPKHLWPKFNTDIVDSSSIFQYKNPNKAIGWSHTKCTNWRKIGFLLQNMIYQCVCLLTLLLFCVDQLDATSAFTSPTHLLHNSVFSLPILEHFRNEDDHQNLTKKVKNFNLFNCCQLFNV